MRRYRRELGRGDDFEVVASASDVHGIDGYRRLGDGGITHILTMPWVFYHGMTEDVDLKVDGVKRFAEDVLEKMR